MVLLRISSSNPEASWVFGKNPTGDPLGMMMKHGAAFGYYNSKASEGTLEYCVLFRSGWKGSSFAQETTYLNKEQYLSPSCVRMLLSEFFATPLSKNHPKDLPAKQSFRLEAVELSGGLRRQVETFARWLQRIEINLTEIGKNIFRIEAVTDQTLSHLLHSLNLIFSFLTCYEDRYKRRDTAFMGKIVRSIAELKPDYYLVYLINSRLFNHKADLDPHLETLETAYGGRIKFVHGNTALQRRNAIREFIHGHHDIIDLGCGEGYYVPVFGTLAARKKKHYYGVDPDPAEMKKFHQTVKKLDLAKTVQTAASLEELIEILPTELKKHDVIVSEVIEHMEMTESVALINRLLTAVHVDTVVITTPNRDFNKYYHLDGFRHDDHRYELTAEEFDAYLAGLTFDRSRFNLEKIAIGDAIDGVTPTQGVVIRPKASA